MVFFNLLNVLCSMKLFMSKLLQNNDHDLQCEVVINSNNMNVRNNMRAIEKLTSNLLIKTKYREQKLLLYIKVTYGTYLLILLYIVSINFQALVTSFCSPSSRNDC